MKPRLISAFIISAFVLGSCTGSKPDIPVNDDLIIYAWRGGWFGLAKSYIFTASSYDPAVGNEIDLESVDFYPEWSPNGQWILSISNEFQQLSIINTSSGEKKKVLTASGDSKFYDASWSPDSIRIAYTILTQGKMEMRWIDVSCFQSGNKCVPLENFIHYGSEPDWSPDGQSIAFTWDQKTNIQNQGKDNVYVMDYNGSGKPRIISGKLEDCHDPDWSTDGTNLVFNCNIDIFISNSDGNGLLNLTHQQPEDPLDPWYPENVQPSWDPKGDRIAFLSQRDTGGLYVGNIDKPRSNALFMMDADGGNIKRVTLDNQIAIDWYAWIIPSK